MATKSKLLVRSHAVRESTSPPRESVHIHNLKSVQDNQQQQIQQQQQQTQTNNPNSIEGNNNHHGGGGDVIVNHTKIYEDESQQREYTQVQQQHQPVENHHQHNLQQQITNSVDSAQDEGGINEDDGDRDSRSEAVDGCYSDNRSNEGGLSDESPNGSGRRVALAKMNGQKKLEQQGSTQSQNGGQKTKFKTMGSSSSMEGVSSGFISRESSCEQYTDHNGISLINFFRETLNKNAKDRNMLLKIEKELYSLASDKR